MNGINLLGFISWPLILPILNLGEIRMRQCHFHTWAGHRDQKQLNVWCSKKGLIRDVIVWRTVGLNGNILSYHMSEVGSSLNYQHNKQTENNALDHVLLYALVSKILIV